MGGIIWAAGGSGGGTLVENWNGTNWNVIPSANNGGDNSALQAVAIAGPADAWAVGSSAYIGATDYAPQSLVEHWDGAAWSIVPSPDGGGLQAVAVLSANDVWAVGQTSFCNRYNGCNVPGTMLTHWDGTAWAGMAGVNPGTTDNGLFGVAGVAADDVWAVGSFASGGPEQPLAAHWDGHTWSMVTVPTVAGQGSVLLGVTAIARDDVWAVGSAGTQTLVEHWDGRAWTLAPGPGPGVLNGVAATSATDLWAAGAAAGSPLITHWDGHAWSRVPFPGTGSMGGVAARTPTDVWAVGATYLPDQPEHPLAFHWDGRAWNGVSSADPDPSGDALAGVAATANDILAVGSMASGWTFAEQYGAGTCVTPTPSPLPPTPTPSPTTCPIQFADVPPRSPFYAPVRCLACAGILSGYADGTFRPGAGLTRGQFAKLLALAAGYGDPIPPARQTFADVPPADPFWLDVERAYAHGALSGYAGGTFRPTNPITRGQAVKLIANAAALADSIPATQQTFADVPPGTPFWLYVERAYQDRVLSGYACGQAPAGPCDSGNRPYFLPNAGLTRGQGAKIVATALVPDCGLRAR